MGEHALPISLEDVRRAAQTIEGFAHRTPVLTSRRLDDATGATVFLKCENFQRGGAFKVRGAYNKMSSLSGDELRAGVLAYSSGNHSQAVAISARALGTRAVILMPDDTPQAKLDATLSYGAEVVTYDRYTQDRVALGEQMAREKGLTLVPPYDDPLVMAGQGTTALELIEDTGGVDVLVAPVGGGGLISGCATAAKGLLHEVSVIGVEPEGGDDTRRSLAEGRRVKIPVPHTIADGLQAEVPGVLTYEVMSAHLDDVALVADSDLVGAMAFLFEIMKIVVEPSGASGVAALLGDKIDVAGRRVGIVISGGNVGLERFRSLVH